MLEGGDGQAAEPAEPAAAEPTPRGAAATAGQPRTRSTSASLGGAVVADRLKDPRTLAGIAVLVLLLLLLRRRR